MTTTVTTSYTGPLAGNGTAPLPFSFQGLTASEIGVIKDNVEITTGFTVTVNDDGTGQVTPTTSWTGSTIYIFSKPDFKQQTDFPRHNSWYPDQLVPPLDRLARYIIVLAEDVRRSIKLALGKNGALPTGSGLVEVNGSGNVVFRDPASLSVPGPAGPAGPAGDVAGMTVASRAVLAGVASPAAGAVRYLAETNRQGLWDFDSSNLSARVTADTQQGLYIAPASDATGASGAWVRRLNGSVNVKWFGATGDGTTNDGAAFLAAIALLKVLSVNQVSGFYQASPALFVPAGHYFLGTNTLDLTHTIKIEGEGTGLVSGGKASKLRWSSGATGIRVQRYNTTGATGTTAPGYNAGDSSIIRGLYLVGGYVAPTEGEFHGIHLRARAVIEDCEIESFEGDGIYSNATAGGSPEGVINLTVINRVSVRSCRRGLYFDGADVNANLITMLNVSGNRTWGIEDSSFLGNTYIGCHAAGNGWDGAAGSTPTAAVQSGNRYAVKVGQAAGASTNAPSGTTADNTWWVYIAAGGTYTGVVTWVSGTTFREGGAYKTDNNNAANIFVGCYSEGDQNPSQIVYPSVVMSGLHGAQVKGSGSYLQGSAYGFVSRLTAMGALTADGTQGFFLDPASPARIRFLHTTMAPNEYSLQWSSGNLIYTYANSLVSTNWAFELTGETTTRNIGTRKINFPNGFGLADKKIRSGTAAPTSGTFVQGDITINSAPAAGGPFGWVCVTGGSPGTWVELRSAAPNVQSTATAPTLTPTFNNDTAYVTELAGPLTIAAPTGTAVDGKTLVIGIKDNGTSRALTWNAIFVPIGVTLPAATTISKWTYVGAKYSAAAAAWHVLGVKTEA